MPDEIYEAAAARFPGKGIADLTIAIAAMNAWNRMAIGFRQGPAADVLTDRNIEAAYHTTVVVSPSPASRRPHVFLVPKETA